jgi:hypothetical protein
MHHRQAGEHHDVGQPSFPSGRRLSGAVTIAVCAAGLALIKASASESESTLRRMAAGNM